MNDDHYPGHDDPQRRIRAYKAGMGVLRVTLLFGSAAVALALLATPYLAGQSHQRISDARRGGLDLMSTGSVGGETYIVRRSVLQASPDAVCVIRDNGRSSGDC
jgi:hypothetical protein